MPKPALLERENTQLLSVIHPMRNAAVTSGHFALDLMVVVLRALALLGVMSGV